MSGAGERVVLVRQVVAGPDGEVTEDRHLVVPEDADPAPGPAPPASPVSPPWATPGSRGSAAPAASGSAAPAVPGTGGGDASGEGAPGLVLRLTRDVAAAIEAGELDPAVAYMQGRLKADGDLHALYALLGAAR